MKANFLNEFAQLVGSTAFWMRILNEIISNIKFTNPSCVLNSEVREDILHKFKTQAILSHANRSDFITLKENVLSTTRLTSYISRCEANGYTPPYRNDQKDTFFNDLLEFSWHEVLSIIDENSDELFSYKLRTNESTYASDRSITNKGNLNIYITLKGLFSFEEITRLKDQHKLTLEVEKILSKEFTVLKREAIIDDFNPNQKVVGNHLDSSLIIGQITEFRELYNSFTKGYHKKVINGFVWVHDDVRGTPYDYLKYHDESDIKGFSKYSMPFQNVLYKYLITYLNKFRFNRVIDDNSLPEGYYLSEPDSAINTIFGASKSKTNIANMSDDDDMPF